MRQDLLPTVFCPGCGNGTVLQYILRAIDELKLDFKKIVFVAGIGCHARLSTGYIAADSMWTIHGRALAVATGVKLAKPDLHVIVLTGDGDAGAIGGNHLIHAARRNIGLTTICFNNRIYGMTGGQASPTTPSNARTTVTPYGNIERPFDLCKLVTAAGASYVARWTVGHAKQAIMSIKKALLKEGFSFVEIVTQCPTYYGRYVLRDGKPAQIIKWLMQNSIPLESTLAANGSDEAMSKITIGEFTDIERPELSKRYVAIFRVAEAAQK
jgi:2-oxoglutarate ferredoxin oxidoreductase subunit beta